MVIGTSIFNPSNEELTKNLKILWPPPQKSSDLWVVVGIEFKATQPSCYLAKLEELLFYWGFAKIGV